MRRFVREGEMFPVGYGMAWRCWERPGCICFPIPINVVAGWIHTWWLDLTAPRALRDDVWGAGEHSGAFLRGVEAGRQLERSRR